MKDWTTKPLGEVCAFHRGLTYAKRDEVDVSDNVVLRASNIDLATNLLNFDELKYINDKFVVPDSKRVKRGSLMICTASGSKSHLGKVAFIDDDYGFAFGGFMGLLTPSVELLPKYLFHRMTSQDYKDFIGALSDGANINNLKYGQLEQFEIPVPPLPEQERIVGILDEAFDGIAKAKALAEANLQNARALFQSHLQSVFSQKGEGWVEKRLGDVCEATQGVQIPKSEQSPIMLTGYRRYLYISDFESEKNLKYVRDEHPKKLVTPSDIIVANTGSAGKIFRGIDGVLSNNLFKVSFDPAKVDGDFIFFFVTSDLFREYQQGIMRGTANPHMGHVNFKSTPLPIPSIQTQKSAVEIIHKINEETQRLESLYQRKLNALDELKKSLLHQAFSGNL
jgi:type I restriction enzyme S subunit